jgi:SAM-dependent methyltransferase
MPSGSAPTDRATPQVSAFYDRFPYPGDPLQDGPPPGYNWRWCHAAAHAHCVGRLPDGGRPLRILDAGCGTGVSTDYLVHLNPGASVTAIDISPGALEVASERLRRSGGLDSVRFACRSLLDLGGEGPFEHINSVGVLHHLADPSGGLRALAGLLAPGGLLHLFLYADGGRWEIQRLQRSLRLLGVGSGAQGLALGRRLLAELPADNRLRRRHEERWVLDTQADANFADMYLHPQETSYDLPRLWELIDGAGLTFLGFSDPERWDPSRLLTGELLERALALPDRERWQLIEALDPEISHFEFFLSDAPLRRQAWQDDGVLLAARGRRNPCLWGWPGQQLLDQDLKPLDLSAEELALLQAIEDSPDEPLASVVNPGDLARVRDLQAKAVLLLQEG